MYDWITFHIVLANNLSGNELIRTFEPVRGAPGQASNLA